MYCSYKEDALFRNPEFDVLPLLGASISAFLFVLHFLLIAFVAVQFLLVAFIALHRALW